YRHHVLHDVAPLDEKRASHRLGGRPGLATVRRAGVQRLVDFLAVPAAFSVSFWTDSPIAVVAPSTLWASSRWAFRSWAAKSNTESTTSAGLGSWSVRGMAPWVVPGTSCWMVSAQVRMPSMTASWLLRKLSSTWVWISSVGSFSVGMGCVLLCRVMPLVLTNAVISVSRRLLSQTWSVSPSPAATASWARARRGSRHAGGETRNLARLL